MEPTIDPATGKPVVPTTPDPNAPPTVAVPAEEWGAMKARLDAFERGAFQQRQEPAAPSTPPGPTLADQLTAIDREIGQFDSQIDEAVANGKPVAKMLRDRDALNAKRVRLQIKHEDLDPALNAGIQTIDRLSDKVTRGDMPYYDIVKDDFDGLLKTMPADQRMNPEIRQNIYNLAVGKNITKITEAQKEEMLRKASEPQGDAPPAGNGRNQPGAGDGVPKPSEVLSRGALDALEMVGKSPDEYYKSRGYKGGWAEYWEKHYKPKGDDK